MNYLLEKLDTSCIRPFKFQEEPVRLLTEFISPASKQQGIALKAGTGVGKMYMTCQAIRNSVENGSLMALKQGFSSYNPFPVLIIVPASIQIQWQRTLKIYGVDHLCHIISYGGLRSSKGEVFMQWVTTIVNGVEVIKPIWNPLMCPALIIIDEFQNCRNEDTAQSRAVRAIPSHIKLVMMSATFGTRVCEHRILLEKCAVVSEYNSVPVTQETSHELMMNIAHPRHPTTLSPSSMRRLRKVLEPYSIDVKGVRFKCRAKSTCTLTDFSNAEMRKLYDIAYEEYLEERRKTNPNDPAGVRALWVAWLKFRERAEILRAPILADMAVKSIKEGKQVIIGSNFVDTLRLIKILLVKEHDFNPLKIGVITGTRSKNERQKDIDAFQAGDKDVMLLMMRSGGVGLSLHHATLDVGRPRHIILPPTWSAIDLVQALGRAHRITSCSDTTQEIIWFKGTIEERVASKVRLKLSCLKEAVEMKEQWVSMANKMMGVEALDEFDEAGDTIETMGDDAVVIKEDSGEDNDEVNDEITGDGLENEETTEHLMLNSATKITPILVESNFDL